MKTPHGDRVRYYRKILLTGFAALLILSCAGLALVAAALELQANAQAYIAGESHWSKGVDAAVFHLDRYAETGERHALEMTRENLDVPLGDLAARDALDREPPDLETARQGFLRGGNSPEVVPGLIRVYRYFRWAPYLKEAIAAWRSTDPHVRRLAEIASYLEARDGQVSPAEREALREEISGTAMILRERSDIFSQAILDGAGWLKSTLIGLTALGAMVFGLIAWLIMYRMFSWLRARDRRFLATFQQAGIGMAQVDLDNRIIDVNPALCATLRMSREELLEYPVSDILEDEDVAETEKLNRQLLNDGHGSYTTKRRFRRGDGSLIWGKLTAALTRTAKGRPEQFIWIVEDVTDAHQLAEQLSYQARHDELTGLYNRREMERRLEVALEDARLEDTRHVFCFIDVDQFKVVNDTCGHVAGDQLLRRIGSMLQTRLRASDVVGRLGGDEFAVILHYTDLDAGKEVADKLRRALGDVVFRWDDRSFRLTATIGLAEITERAGDVTWVLRAADTACHLAKDMGRDRVHAFEESDEAVAEHWSGLQWLGTIQRALDDDRLVLFGQRIEPLQDGMAPHYEVLVRLLDENGQQHSPAAFLPAAERYGLVSMVDMRVLEKTLSFLSRHPGHLDGGGRVHINVSGASVSSRDFHEFVLTVIDRYKVPGEQLCFEITETAAMANLKDAWAFFDMVRNRGVCIALDDFGSGMSSFNYLKNLPASILKIDGAFVQEMESETRDYAVVRAINDVAKALGKTTVAEFVESRATMGLLRELGVDFGQGFGIHRPEPLENLFPAAVAEGGADWRP